MNQQRNVRAGIMGGAGYTGGELLRLLLRHPNVEIAFVHSRSQSGRPLSELHPDLLGETALCFTDRITEADVVFLCVGHGEAKELLAENPFGPDLRIIDLSQDHRLQSPGFRYGLPEAFREEIRSARRIANPGCFATAIQLALLPLAQAGKLGPVHLTAITGATGAGQKLQPTSHFAWRAGNIQAYKALEHQHLAEVGQTLTHFQPAAQPLHFIPWRGDFTRGIYLTACMPWDASEQDAYDLYEAAYSRHPFTHISQAPVHLKQVVNTNKCVLSLEARAGQLLVHAAIDNLLKGASGQAVQNMNLMMGLPETAGLQLKASFF